MVLEHPHNCESHKKSSKKIETKIATKPVAKVKNEQSQKQENTEQAPEVSTSTADDVLLPRKSSEDVALILSAAEEEAELCTNANEEIVKVEPKAVVVDKPKRLKKESSKSVWVSNIPKGTKAADLKKLFSENFKVESAKIVTNGKSFFGYITLETTEMVQKSVKALNGFNLAGKNIAVSLMRPDVRTARASTTGEQIRLGKEKKKQLDLNEALKDNNNKNNEGNQIKKHEVSKDISKDTNNQTTEKKLKEDTRLEDKKIKSQVTKVEKVDKIVESLKKKLDTANSELRITKRRLRDSNNRLEFERARKTELIKQVSRLESELKSERRKMNQEREQTEKRRKLDDIRFEADRAILNKELDECKKLREYLQTRVDEMKMRVRHRSRSPVSRNLARREGPSERNHSDFKFQRSRALHVSPPKHRSYEAETERQRSPPPPPKLNKCSPSPRNRERSPYNSSKRPRIEYSQGSYPSGSSGGTRPSLPHYSSSDSLGASARGSVWESSSQMTYRYSSTPGQTAYPLFQGTVLPTKPVKYSEFPKKMSGGFRKY